MAERETKLQFAADEDLERAKALWKENGRSIVVGISIGLASILGYNYWQYDQRTEGEDASVLFDQLTADEAHIDQTVVSGDLMDRHADSPYASLAALMMAKRSVEDHDLDGARDYLQWVLDHAGDDGLAHIARLRLGSVLLAQRQPDSALALLTVDDMSTYSARYHELRGDAYEQKEEIGLSRNAYQESLNALSASSGIRALVQLKLDNTNGN